MNILIFTKNEWSDENSTGNTFTNLFSDIDEKHIANVYCKNTQPKNNVCVNYYSVSDLDIIKSFVPPFISPGKAFQQCNKINERSNSKTVRTENHLYNVFRGKNKILPLTLQNMLWSTNRWDNKNLDRFLEEFKPDIIFVPTFQNIYTNKVLWKLKEKTKAEIVLFLADDYFHDENNQRSTISNIYYNKRKNAIIKSIELASLHYCISKKQQKEYSKRFNINMKLLYKGGAFESQPDYQGSNDKKIKFVYIGSLYYGRWKTLSLLVKKIEEKNKNSNVKFYLDIYSQYPVTEEILKNIELNNVSKFHGKIPSEKVNETMQNADIVLHIESFEEEERKLTRLSFSTKIVDCLESGRALFAIGDKEAASIDYLSENNIALVANNESDINLLLSRIEKEPSILQRYADKGWSFGQKNHQVRKIKQNLYNDLKDIIKGK